MHGRLCACPSFVFNMEILSSNVFARIGTTPGKIFQIIDDLNELRDSTVSPDLSSVNPTTVLTLFYEKEVDRNVAFATTMLIKKGIEAEIKMDKLKFGMIGCLDHNIAFKAIPKKEFAIYFDALVCREKINSLLKFLLHLLEADKIGVHYGYEPPKVFASHLYMLPYILGFFRADLLRYFSEHGFNPKNLKIYHEKNMVNSIDNVVGTHGNVILVTEVGSEPLTILQVPTNRGTFPLKLILREFMASPSNNNYRNSEDSDTVPNSRLYKSVLCRHYNKRNGCNNGSECKFAHGKSDLKTNVDVGVSRQFTNAAQSTNGAASGVKQFTTASLRTSRQSVSVSAPVDEQSTDDLSTPASPFIGDRAELEDVISASVPIGNAVTVSEEAPKTDSAVVAGLVDTSTKKLDVSVPASTIAMRVVFVEKDSGLTAVPKTPSGATASVTDVDEVWPGLGDDTGVKSHRKRAASSTPGSASPGTGGANSRRSQANRTVTSTSDSAGNASSFINPCADGDTPAEWTVKRNGKNVSPIPVSNTTTPMRFNKSGYPVVTTVPTTAHRGKNNALFGAILRSPPSNSFDALATDTSASMDH